MCRRWSGRYENQPFATRELYTGEFTCEASCDRAGSFIIAEEGALCCYGPSRPKQHPEDPTPACDRGHFDPNQHPVLLCALDEALLASVDYVEQTCDDALGLFQWAGEETSPYDPNALVWGYEPNAPTGEVPFNQSTLEP
ncbi:MAG: hypothetical protein QM778_28460 [Myxococcales bacterium]